MRVTGRLPYSAEISEAARRGAPLPRRELCPAGTRCVEQLSVRTMLSEISDLFRAQEITERAWGARLAELRRG